MKYGGTHNVQFRLAMEGNPFTDAFLSRLSAQGVGTLARREVIRFYALLAKELAAIPRFTAPEAQVLVEAGKGVDWSPETIPQLTEIVGGAMDQDGLAEKHGIEAAPLVRKLEKLGPAQRFAVVDAIERYWIAQPESTVESVGLVKTKR